MYGHCTKYLLGMNLNSGKGRNLGERQTDLQVVY